MLLVDIMEVPPIEREDGIEQGEDHVGERNDHAAGERDDHVGAKDDEDFDEDYYPDIPNDDDEELISKFKVFFILYIFIYIDDRSVHMHAVVYTLRT